MSTEIGRGYVPVTFDKSQIGRDLSSSIEQGARDSEGKIGGTFKRLAGLAAGAFAVVKGVDFFGDSIAAARESNKVAAQTEAVIKSTGAAAGLTSKQFGDLANSIAMKTGIDDEQIQTAENLLATFTNVRDAAGAGNDVFSQTTKLAADMATALGGDASSAAMQLGKALNDPTAGMLALTRSGVSFTQEQKEQIKAMQASGDLLGAQKLILAEVSKEFGGSAEATATAGAKWGVFWGNLQEKFGNLLIPALDATAEWAMTTLPNAFGVLQDVVGPVVTEISDDFGSLLSAFQEGDTFGFSTSDGLIGWAIVLGATLRDVWDVAAEFFSTLTTGFTNDDAATGAESLALILRDDLWPIIQSVAGFMADHWQPILIGLGAAFALVTAPITTITVGLVVLYARSKTFRDLVATVVSGLTRFGESVMDVFHQLQDSLGPAFLAVGASLADLARFFAERWDKIRASVETVLNILKIALGVFIAPFVLAWTYFHDQILAVVQLAWDQISTVFSTALRVIGDVFDVIISLLSGDWAGAWEAAKDIPAAFVDFVKGTLGNLLTFAVDFFSSLPGNILTALGDLTTKLLGAGTDLISGMKNGIIDGFAGIAEWFAGLPSKIGEFVKDAGSWLYDVGVRMVQGLIDGIRSMWDKFVEAINPFSHIGGGPLPAPMGGDAPGRDIHDPMRHARGGIFDRPTFGMFGEAGREVILPLTDARRTWELAGQSGLLNVLAQGMPFIDMPGVAAGLARAGGGGQGVVQYNLTGSGDVVMQEPEDMVVAFRRLELLSGHR